MTLLLWRASLGNIYSINCERVEFMMRFFFVTLMATLMFITLFVCVFLFFLFLNIFQVYYLLFICIQFKTRKKKSKFDELRLFLFWQIGKKPLEKQEIRSAH